MISVIVTTFQRARHLELCLAGVGRQAPGVLFEVIVADDGSTDGTADVVGKLRKRAAFDVKFVRQEHEGFRLARLRNQAAQVARGDYLVFLDGDCVPCDHWLEGHARARRPGTFGVGARHQLTEAETARVTRGQIEAAGVSPSIPRRERRRLKRLLGWNRLYRLTGLKDRPKLVGANFGVWLADYEAVNGFDERFVGWGFEDEDFSRRLTALGRRKVSVVAEAPAVHLWHLPDPSFRGRARLSANSGYFHRGYFLRRCRHGYRERAVTDLAVRCRDLPRVQKRFPAGGGESGEVDLVLSASHRDGAFEIRGGIVRRGAPSPRGVPLVIEVEAEDLRGEEAAREIVGMLDELV